MTNAAHTSSGEGGTGVAEQTQDKAKEVASQAQDKAREAAGQARGRIRDQVDQRSTQAGQQVSSTASDVRTIAQQLREQGKDQPAKLADQAADRVERVGNYLTQSDGDSILHDVEDFGRRQPWAVLAGAATVGFALSRLLKASSSRRYEQSRGYSSQGFSGESYGGGRFERQIPATPSPVTTPATGSPVPPPTVPPTGGTTETLGAERR